LLLRIAKRGAAAETARADLEQFCLTEFQNPDGPGLDLSLSVYQIEPEQEQIVRAQAEHYARERLGRQTRTNFDLAGLTPQPIGFAFTDGAHRAVPFAADEDVMEMARRLVEDLDSRLYKVQKSQMREYARRQRDLGDPEWLAFYAADPADW
jgi:hypothetical protein